jgi:Holliday junction resolvase RusA-like endonuclease
MNSAIWHGDAVSVNDWHGVAERDVLGKNGKKTKKGVIYKKPKYREFVRSLAVAFKKQLTPVTGYVEIDLLMFLDPSKDTDGPFKPIFDALEMAGIIVNDRLNHAGTYNRFDRTAGFDTIVISVKELHRDGEFQQTDFL